MKFGILLCLTTIVVLLGVGTVRTVDLSQGVTRALELHERRIKVMDCLQTPVTQKVVQANGQTVEVVTTVATYFQSAGHAGETTDQWRARHDAEVRYQAGRTITG